MPWLRSPRFRRLPTVDNDPVQDLTDRQKTLQKAHGILALKALRTQRGLALPSPRFGTGLELLRSSPRCRMVPEQNYYSVGVSIVTVLLPLFPRFAVLLY